VDRLRVHTGRSRARLTGRPSGGHRGGAWSLEQIAGRSRRPGATPYPDRGHELVELETGSRRSPTHRRHPSVLCRPRRRPLHVFVPHATAGLPLMELGSGSEVDLDGSSTGDAERTTDTRPHGSAGHGADTSSRSSARRSCCPSARVSLARDLAIVVLVDTKPTIPAPGQAVNFWATTDHGCTSLRHAAEKRGTANGTREADAHVRIHDHRRLRRSTLHHLACETAWLLPCSIAKPGDAVVIDAPKREPSGCSSGPGWCQTCGSTVGRVATRAARVPARRALSSHLLVTNDFRAKVGASSHYLWELWSRLEPRPRRC